MNDEGTRKSIGVAVVGCGDIGALRAQAVTQCPGLKLLFVSDLDEARARAVARRYGASVSPWEAAVQHPSVDLVIVATPPNAHRPVALPAFAEKKHVLCEKPLAHTLEDAEQMCLAAEENGVLLKTGFNHRYFRSIVRAKEIASSGRIGKIVSVRAYAGHPGGREFGHAWVQDGSVTGGGALIDNGIHILDLTRFFLADVDRAQGYAMNLVWPFPSAEDNGIGLFRTPGGAVAQVHASWTEWRGYRFSIEANGTRGYVRASYPPMLLEYGQLAAAGETAKRRFELFPMFQALERLRGWQWTILQSFVAELSDFARAIHAGQPATPTSRDGLRALQMAHAVYVSSREGREVRF